ncbi:MAG TPA: hypothetical protein VLB02_01710 [Candidatus Paceibacterota bacterium]|nr:hypothetical protein [Candidatus Paceibacterota bacterium]
MKSFLHLHAENLRAIITGFLLVFIFFIARELVDSPFLLLEAVAVMALAVFLAKKTAHHFHGHHTHAGDSPIDTVALIVLFAANILHPAVDGFSIFETFEIGGTAAGIIFAGSVVLHEIFRQSALVAAFSTMHIRWGWVVGTALAGITLGVGTGFLGSEIFHENERIIDLVTLFAYAFIIAEFHFSGHAKYEKRSWWFIALGITLSTALSLIAKVH